MKRPASRPRAAGSRSTSCRPCRSSTSSASSTRCARPSSSSSASALLLLRLSFFSLRRLFSVSSPPFLRLCIVNCSRYRRIAACRISFPSLLLLFSFSFSFSPPSPSPSLLRLFSASASFIVPLVATSLVSIRGAFLLIACPPTARRARWTPPACRRWLHPAPRARCVDLKPRGV